MVTARKSDEQQLADYAVQVAARGEGLERMVRLVVRVGTCEWPLKARLRLAWLLVRGR